MATHRINGIPFNPDHLTDIQLQDLAVHQGERVASATEGYETVMGWLMLRGLIPDMEVDDSQMPLPYEASI